MVRARKIGERDEYENMAKTTEAAVFLQVYLYGDCLYRAYLKKKLCASQKPKTKKRNKIDRR